MNAIQSLVVLLGLLVATPAFAYLGPGAGLGMLGSLFAVVGAILLAIVGILIFPVRMFLKKRRKDQAQADARQ